MSFPPPPAAAPTDTDTSYTGDASIGGPGVSTQGAGIWTLSANQDVLIDDGSGDVAAGNNLWYSNGLYNIYPQFANQGYPETITPTEKPTIAEVNSNTGTTILAPGLWESVDEYLNTYVRGPALVGGDMLVSMAEIGLQVECNDNGYGGDMVATLSPAGLSFTDVTSTATFSQPLTTTGLNIVYGPGDPNTLTAPGVTAQSGNAGLYVNVDATAAGSVLYFLPVGGTYTEWIAIA